MKQHNLTILTDVYLITCIVQKGKADDIVAAARAVGAQGATVHYARGTGVRERLGVLSIAVEAEKEIIQIVVSAEQKEEVFATMFEAGELDAPGRGIMYVTELEKAATYIPAEVLEQLEAQPLMKLKRHQEAQQDRANDH